MGFILELSTADAAVKVGRPARDPEAHEKSSGGSQENSTTTTTNHNNNAVIITMMLAMPDK